MLRLGEDGTGGGEKEGVVIADGSAGLGGGGAGLKTTPNLFPFTEFPMPFATFLLATEAGGGGVENRKSSLSDEAASGGCCGVA